MTIEIRSEAEGWTASVTDGVWECSDPDIARWLQTLCEYAYPPYAPDRDWAYARIAAAEFFGGSAITIVTPEPVPDAPPAGAVF